MQVCPPDPVKMAREVIDHLSRQRGEEDTLEHIQQRVLPEKPDPRQVTMLKESVGDLVTQGLLERTVSEGRVSYRIKKR